MSTRVRGRLTLLAGVALLSMAVFATAAQVASGMRVEGSGQSGTESVAPAGSAAAVAHANIVHERLAAAAVAPAQAGSSGISSTTLWIVAGVVAGLLLIVAWALLRRRSGLATASEANAFCTLNAEDARCRAV